ncbi:hypothetical protein [Zophobihabitans entericus]|uniref:Uncharacterized protein n=1 Tax=Zophobihabitans entericus TaxID=1635327 RepID=A0A6G9ID26_9GAMM|nr:hypothetical protein [Zophobihabitans entericus]QIQ22138.1 hypothetical protein IPMB12_10855 [Zophobihabitans entericus]
MAISGIDLKKQTHALLQKLCDMINNDDLDSFNKLYTSEIEGEEVDAKEVFEEIKELILDYCEGYSEPPIKIQPPPLEQFLKEYDPEKDNLIQFYFIKGNKDKYDEDNSCMVKDEIQYTDGQWNVECILFVDGKETSVILQTELFYSNNVLRLEYKILDLM